MKKLLIAMATLFISSLASMAEDQKDNPLIGLWRGFKFNQLIECNPDGSFTLLENGKKKSEVVGSWKQVQSKSVERKYELSWYQGKFIHDLTLNKTGDKLTGSSSGGAKIDAVKIKDTRE